MGDSVNAGANTIQTFVNQSVMPMSIFLHKDCVYVHNKPL